MGFPEKKAEEAREGFGDDPALHDLRTFVGEDEVPVSAQGRSGT